MKKYGTIFNIANFLALAGWLLLVIFHQKSWLDQTLIYGLIGLLALFYIYSLFVLKNIKGERYPKGSFSNYQGVVNFFKNPRVVLAGWIHYLAFDLLAGIWIKNDALAHDITFWWIVPSLFLTLMFGPLGLLSYLILKLLLV